jgi:hypothetical protein
VAVVERLCDQWRLLARAADLLAPPPHGPAASTAADATARRPDDSQAADRGRRSTARRGDDGNNNNGGGGGSSGPDASLQAAGAAVHGRGVGSAWAAVAVGQWRRALASNCNDSNTAHDSSSSSAAAAAAAAAERARQLHVCAAALSVCTLPWPAVVELQRALATTAAACKQTRATALDALLDAHAEPLPTRLPASGALASGQAGGPTTGQVGGPPTAAAWGGVVLGGGDAGSVRVAAAAAALDAASAALKRADAAVEFLFALPVDAPGALFVGQESE